MTMAWPAGKALADKIKGIQGHSRIILGFSRGKDAIGAGIELMKHFDEVIPVYYDPLPGLELTSESIDYYERKLFKRKIHVFPHHNFLRMLKNSVAQSYEGFYLMQQLPFPRWSIEDVRRTVCELEGLPDLTFQATGVRSADSVTRMTALRKHGPVTMSKRTVHIIWDWKKDRLIEEMQRAKIRLPIDYAIWGRTLDGIDARFMLPMRHHLPEDFKRACLWFPLIPADIIRYERIRREQGQEIV